MERITLEDWTVDYGAGPRACSIPHAWQQDVDVRWEGPAVYERSVDVPDKPCWLVFQGVSYAARVFVNDELVAEHHGIWEAFSVPLIAHRASQIALRVEVVKNGGAGYPVRDVASGFLPFVFNTFGGIYREVELVESDTDPLAEMPPAPPCRVKVEGTKIFVDGKPFYLRAPLTWGWYPEFGHTNPDEETMRKEVRQMKSMGFNTCKFCLWVPHHRFFEILEEEGMFAWLELPLWDPTPNAEKQEAMFEELRRIVLEYRRHSNIIVWTCGCELSSNTTAEYRERLYKMVKELTGAALVKDNSGGSEMYGGDLREFGDFYDFHPYCDLPFYPLVLDSLMVGPRKKMPILLGEFNDYDVFRDLARLKKERPFWTSQDPYLNDQGSRWQQDLPGILDRYEGSEDATKMIEERSWWKACFIRKLVHEHVRSRSDIAGYVITGWRDTPIASSGMVDDWGAPRMDFEGDTWNTGAQFFLIPDRRPPWQRGGNRPGWIDTTNHFMGPIHFRVGLHQVCGLRKPIRWSILKHEGVVTVASGEFEHSSTMCDPTPLGEVVWVPEAPGSYSLRVESGQFGAGWLINVFDKPDFSTFKDWRIEDPRGILEDLQLGKGVNVLSTNLSGVPFDRVQRTLLLLSDEGTRAAPFWREAFQENSDALIWRQCWEMFLAVSPDRVIDLDALQEAVGKLEDLEVLINRIDTRTYREDPILIRAKVGKGTLVATTLRPYGGLGIQPVCVMNNPAGAALLESLIKLAEEPYGLR